jgi:hypothetical protein
VEVLGFKDTKAYLLDDRMAEAQVHICLQILELLLEHQVKEMLLVQGLEEAQIAIQAEAEERVPQDQTLQAVEVVMVEMDYQIQYQDLL